VCLAGVAKDCDDKKPCTLDTCVSASGACQNDAKAMEGKPCDDANPCTVEDACTAGVCQASKFNACDDANPCTKDSCDPKKGCLHDQNACDDANACTADVCDSKTGLCTHPAAAGPCEDGNPCTEGDACAAGTCKAGSPKGCDDAKGCTTDSCEPKTGQCLHTSTCPEKEVCASGSICASTCTQPSGCSAGCACHEGVCSVLAPLAGTAWTALVSQALDVQPPGSKLASSSLGTQKPGSREGKACWLQGSDLNRLWLPLPGQVKDAKLVQIEAEVWVPAGKAVRAALELTGQLDTSPRLRVWTGVDAKNHKVVVGEQLPSAERYYHFGEGQAVLGQWVGLRLDIDRAAAQVTLYQAGQPLATSPVAPGILGGDNVLLAADAPAGVPAEVCWAGLNVRIGVPNPALVAKCAPLACGDGVVAGAERCDDGNAKDGDGCSAKCLPEGVFAAWPEAWKVEEAKAACAARGGALGRILSKADNDVALAVCDAVVNLDPAPASCWLGGIPGKVAWTWAAGEAMTWTNWASGQPAGTGQCMVLGRSGLPGLGAGAWAAAACTEATGLLCRFDKAGAVYGAVAVKAVGPQ
jgi:cysteine-rich repeat protein